MRTALKYAFTLTLSLVLLISLLASVYGAFYFSRRLVVPIQLLMQGTRAVARGDFATRVPTPTRDEIGFLVHSFNDMTQRLAKASEEARSSQQQVESERRKLEVILARLSTGVVALEPDMRIRTANQAASAILGEDLERHKGESVTELAPSRPLLAQFVAVASAHLQRGDSEWREQIALRGDGARRVLMCACTELPTESGAPGGYVIVFDDITALLQAQRDAAWGEVARRLAHEIKNPLTPIQLSAERLRRKYLKTESGEIDLLDRATHTIIQQVEAMKQMVNAFSEYARTPEHGCHALRRERADRRGQRALSREPREAASDQARARPGAFRVSKPTRDVFARCCTICCATRSRRPSTSPRRRSRSRPGECMAWMPISSRSRSSTTGRASRATSCTRRSTRTSRASRRERVSVSRS